MQRRIRLSFLFLIVLMWWGCSGLKTVRDPAGAMDAGIVGPKGEVILFYKKNHKIVVKQCEDHTILKSQNDCQVKPGTVVQKVSPLDFQNALKTALRLPGGDYDAETRRKIELYKEGQRDDLEELATEQKDLKAKVTKIEAFIEELGSENADTGRLANLKARLSQVEEDLGDYAQLDQIIKEINGEIGKLIDEIISGRTFHRYVFSKQKTGFIFNILRAYLRDPIISAPFKKIVPKESFLMGSPSNEDGRDSDEKQVRVTISKSFEIMSREVTQMQWFLVTGDNPSKFKRPEHCSNHLNINGQGLCPDNPVERVSWNDVQSYIKRLNDALGFKNCRGTPQDGKGCYRLPTEAEWEYAARGGTTTAYSFGNDSSKLANYGWYRENSEKQTHPVGLKTANRYGLYDMHGNVWEWVQDKYHKTLGGGTDPLHTSSGSSRVVRGGGWSNSALRLRSANRSYGIPVSGYDYFGLRLVRTL